jgi:hypothetical protein
MAEAISFVACCLKFFGRLLDCLAFVDGFDLT